MKFNKIPVRYLLWAILLLAFVVRFGYVLTLDDELKWYDEKNYQSIATNLANGNGYESSFNPYSTTSWAPAFPILMSFLYWIFGPHVLVVRFVQLILSSLICYFIYLIGKEVYNENVGLLAGLIMAVHPLFIYTSGALYPLIMFTLLILIICFILIKIISSEKQEKITIKLMLIGFLIGLAMLTKPVIIFLFPVIPLGFWIGVRQTILKTIKYSMIVFFVTLLTILPWTLRNYFKYQRIYLITEEGGNSFYTANVPWYKLDRTKESELPPEIEKELAGLSDLEINEYYKREAINFISKSPIKFSLFYLKKAGNFWRFYPRTISQNRDTSKKNIIVSMIFYGFVLPLSFLGMIVSLKHWRKFIIIFGAIFSFNFGYAVFMTSIRYRMPVEPYILIFTAIGLVTIYHIINTKLIKASTNNMVNV